MKQGVFILFFLLLAAVLHAQEVPIGSWATHFTYNASKTVDNDGNGKIFAANVNLFVYDSNLDEYTTYSKINGLHDQEIKLIRYNRQDEYLIIIYENSNIDIFKDGTFYNLPSIKNAQGGDSKRIQDVYFYNHLIYLSSDLGVIVLNPNALEIKETYTLLYNNAQAKILSFCEFKNQFIACTDKGIFTTSVFNNAILDFNTWTYISALQINRILNLNDEALYFNDKNVLYRLTDINNSIVPFYNSPSEIISLNLGLNHVYTSEFGNNYAAIKKFDAQGNIMDSTFAIFAQDITEVGQGLYIADGYQGLQYLPNSSDKIKKNPDGPYSSDAYRVNYSDGKILLMAGGPASWQYAYNRNGFSVYDYKDWKWYNQFVGIKSMDTFMDVTQVVIDPVSKSYWMASYGGGLMEMKTDGSINIFKNNGAMIGAIGDPSGYRVLDLVYDDENNLWFTLHSSPNPLVVKKQDGTFQSFSLPFTNSEHWVFELCIDDAGQKWIVAPYGKGLIVYNDNHTIDNKSDDQSKLLRVGLGLGNLPSNFVNCVAKDRDGAIWVGTTEGIAIFNCPESVLSSANCSDAELKIVQYDANAGLLFHEESVRTIAVDGANNKWIGTTNGVWQISSDGETILQRFNTKNSPLPSDEINKIIIDPNEGTIFIATAKGLVSYRSSATAPKNNSDDLLIFPNPVPSQYEGTIAIKNLTEDADVRITDLSGQLVYKTKAQGGQAVWNGKTYTGQRPVTGVYYVFVTNKDGSQTKTGKFVFKE